MCSVAKQPKALELNAFLETGWMCHLLSKLEFPVDFSCDLPDRLRATETVQEPGHADLRAFPPVFVIPYAVVFLFLP